MTYFISRLRYFVGTKLRDFTFPLFFYFFLRVNLNSWIVNFYLYSIVPKESRFNHTKNILFLEKGVFNDEIKEVFSDKKFKLLQLNRKFTKSLSNFCFKKKVNQHNFKIVRNNKKHLDNFRHYLEKAFKGLNAQLFVTVFWFRGG